jgi:D-beta-D-heptose 7-phosphate kinase/D-beta-D-heptose 1-phosphate adenosyltransferase
VKALLKKGASQKILVVGDVMLDQFIWGRVARISPEAPVPVVDFERESFMPGGAANVARNLAALQAPVELIAVVGKDQAGRQLRQLLTDQSITCDHLLSVSDRPTSVKTRIVAHQQQVVRVDRELREPLSPSTEERLLRLLEEKIPHCAGVIVGDYGKGLVTQSLLDELKEFCRLHAVWLSLDPKPTHRLHLTGLSLITPNRKEAFELAGEIDGSRAANPLQDQGLMTVAAKLLSLYRPALLLITLGDNGMLLCQQGQKPFHVPTVAQEVFDVSGAGDTVIASFTLAVSAGASPVEAAIFSNHAAGVVVGKVGTATVSPDELLQSFSREQENP